MKIYVQGDGYGWIIDEIVNDYKKFTRHTISTKPDLAWSVSIHHLPHISSLQCPKVITVHHIDPLKLQGYGHIWKEINSMAKATISPNQKTIDFASCYISRPMYRLPYWLIDNRRAPINEEEVFQLKKEIKKEDNEIIIGYFQKDSEGKSCEPKLCKGPDIFLKIIIELNKIHNIRILLSGSQRKYLIDNFTHRGIKFSYYPMYKNINNLYDVCDWYFVTSRTEGGPQSILEAPYRNVKILSRDVGIARDVLPEYCICNTIDDFINKFNEDNIPLDHIKKIINEKFIPEILIPQYDNLLEEIWKQ